MTNAHQIDLRWDNGWYVCVFDESGDVLVDSQKIWFPVDLDEFTLDERKDVIAALSEAYPDAII
jgi:hypothetical protein